ncbi:G-type lectin S-receptor-like serine/threonine-protein kinase [Artemisia annua]|uniref:G-type lectin S-receptor-like serine/threonine-protein kinase n=1 Tax=Artemisia annua TaxID=35608 RepID=A0A2U1P948_ARTAN|nr:G-type lectin S-receptor-like serine/threonine-protein kinase [Artemisia annua]
MRNKDDPAPGLFLLEIEPSKKQYICKWNGSRQYWTSGPWNGHSFEIIPEMRLNSFYNFSFHMNENESYFTYSMYDPSTISRFKMDVSRAMLIHLSIINVYFGKEIS